jgi:hypothetical protein
MVGFSRHYGLITPLLDWTEKPFIAAFFPLYEQFESDLYGNIDTQGKGVVIYKLVHDDRLESDDLRVIRPTVDELGRLQGQRGIFTWLDSV